MMIDHLSAHTINMYRSCPMRYKHYIDHIEEHDTMLTKYGLCGNAVHTWLDSYYRNGIVPNVSNMLVDKDCSTRFVASLSGWADMRNIIPCGIETEKRIDVNYKGVTITGRLDLYHQFKDGRIYIGDHKTSKPGSSTDMLQGQLYIWMVRRITDVPADKIRCEFLYYTTETVVNITYLGDDYVESIIDKVMSDITSDKFPARVGQRCSVCGYNYMCSAWKYDREV